MAMSVRFWGTRGGIPTPGPGTVHYGGNTPCVEVQAGGQNLICDAGTGIRPLGQDVLRRGPGPYEAHIFIGHCHWDHIQGFPFFAPAYVPGNRVTVYGSQGSGRAIREVLEGQMAHDFFPVEIKDLGADTRFVDLEEGTFTLGAVEVSTLHLNHPGLSMAIRLRHEGRTMVYSSDTEPFRFILQRQQFPAGSALDAWIESLDRRVADFARDADLLVVDGQYTVEQYAKKLGWGHNTMDEAAEIGHRAGAKRVAIYHHDPLHDDAFLDAQFARLTEAFRKRGSRTEVIGAREGLALTL